MGDNDASEDPKEEKKKSKSKKNKDSDKKEDKEGKEKSRDKKKDKKKKKKGHGDSDPESKEESKKSKGKDETDFEDAERDKEKKVNEDVEPYSGGDNQRETGGEEKESKSQDKEIDKTDANGKKQDNGRGVNEDPDDEEDDQKESVKEGKEKKSKKKKDKKDAKAKKGDKGKKVNENLSSEPDEDNEEEAGHKEKGSGKSKKKKDKKDAKAKKDDEEKNVDEDLGSESGEGNEEETGQKEKGSGKSKDKNKDKKDRKDKESPKGKEITEDSRPDTEDDNDEEPEPQEEKQDYRERKQSIEVGKELNEDERDDELVEEVLEMLQSRSSKDDDETERPIGSNVSDKYDINNDEKVFGGDSGRGNVARTGRSGSTTSKTNKRNIRKIGSFDNGKRYDWIVDELDDDDEDVSPMYQLGKKKEPLDDLGEKRKEKKNYIADELDGDDEDLPPMSQLGKSKKPGDDLREKSKEKRRYSEVSEDVFDDANEFDGKKRSMDSSKDKRKGRKGSENYYTRRIRFDNEVGEDGFDRQRSGSQDSRRGSQNLRKGSQDSRRGRGSRRDSREDEDLLSDELRPKSIDMDTIDRLEEDAELFNKLEEMDEKEREQSDEMKNMVNHLESIVSGLNQNSVLMFNLLHQQRQSDRGSVRATGSIGISRASYSNMMTVQVKVVFSRVTDIDTIGQQFAAEVHVQARWVERALQGKSEKQLDEIPFTEIWDPKLTIINIVGGLEKDRLSVMVRYEEEEVHPVVTYMWCVKAVFMEVLELEHFPFDTQELSVILSSDRPMDEIDLIPDDNNMSSVGPTAVKNSQEWKSFSHVDIAKDFRSTDVSNNTMHPVLIASAHVRRRLGFYMWNVFIIVFLILGLSLTILSIDPTGNDRLGVNMTLFLTCVAFKLVVKTTLPHISYLTYLDIYVVFTMMYLAAQAFENAIISHLARFKNREKVIMYDEIAQSILIALLVLFHAAFLVYIRLTAFRRRRQMAEKDHAHHLKAVELKNKSQKGHRNSQPPEGKKDGQMNDSHINSIDSIPRSNNSV